MPGREGHWSEPAAMALQVLREPLEPSAFSRDGFGEQKWGHSLDLLETTDNLLEVN